MKHFILFCLFSAGLLVACNNNKTNDSAKTEETNKETGSDEKTADNKTTNSADAMTQKIEELKKLTPLTTDQVKAIFPDEYMGMNRSNFSVNSGVAGMGTVFGSATYKGEGDKELKVNIWDCAGEAGSAIYGMKYYTLWNFQHEDDNGYQKTVDFNGQKAIEQYSKSNDEYTLSYVANDRLLVVLSGEKMGLDAVKEAGKNLNLK